MNNNNIHPLVSICCITYNHEKYIRDAVEGFLMQKTDFPIEILIYDDASTDKTAEIIREYEAKFPDIIRPLYQTENQYSRGVRIIAPQFNFPRARGKYIAMCEGDDYWTDPFKLQKQVDFLERNQDFAICFHNMQIVYEDNPYLNRISNINQQEITTIETLAYRNYIYTASCIFRNCISELPDWLYQCPIGDYPLHLLNAQYGKIKFIDELMGVYRIHKGGIWGHTSLSYRLEKWAELLDIISNKFSEDINQILNNQLFNIYFQLAEYYLKNRDSEKCKLYLMKIISDNPNYLLEAIKTMMQEKTEGIRIQNSYSYKLGNIILDPIRRIRSIAKYFIRSLNTFRYQARDIFLQNESLKKPGINSAKISIIIPTLSKDSQADHLPKLKQLLSEYLPNQEYNNYEALVYCDGFNPLVEKMVAILGDNRIKVYATDCTIGKLGHPQTRMGIAIASGDFFVRMNDDNKPYKNYLHTLISSFDEESGITYGRIIYKGEAKKAHNGSLKYSYVIPGDKKGLLKRGNVDCMNYMIKMDVAKKYMDYWHDDYAADWHFLEALLNNDIKAKFIDRIIGEKF